MAILSSSAMRSTVYQLIGLSLLMAVLGTIQFLTLRQQINDEVIKSGKATLETLEALLNNEPGLLNGGRLQAVVAEVASGAPDVARISVVDRQLRVVADSDSTRVGKITDQTAVIGLMIRPAQDTQPLFYSRAGLLYARISDPLMRSRSARNDRAGDVLGVVTVDIGLSGAQARLRSAFERSIAVLGLLLGLYLSGQYLLFRRNIFRPLAQVARAADRFGAGDLDTRLPLTDGASEFASVGRAFNHMAEEIGRSQASLRDSRAALDSIIQTSPLAIIQQDRARKVTLWNPAAERMFGWSQAEGLDAPLRTIPADREDEASAAFAALESGQSLVGFSTQAVRKDGSRLDIKAAAVTVRDAAGAVRSFNAIVEDVSSLRRAEAAIKSSNIELSLSVQRLEQRTRELALLGELGELLQACKSQDEAQGVLAMTTGKLFPGASGTLYEFPASRDQMEPQVSWGQLTNEAEPFSPDACWAMRLGHSHLLQPGQAGLVCRHVANEPASALGYLCVPMMAQGEAIGLLHLRCLAGEPGLTAEGQRLAETLAEHTALAISNLKLRDALRQQSIRDGLTGLFNRRYLDETLTREIARARRGKASLCILMMDVDHFKRFNDQHGHEAGDFVLKSLGELLRTQVRVEDIACRYGGEEFTLILPGASIESSLQRAEQLRQAIRQLNLSFDGTALGTLTLSFGVAAFPDHGDSGEAVLHAADAALYRAKRNGRDRSEVAI